MGDCSRASPCAGRLSLSSDVRQETCRVLAPFAIANSAPDPAMPWAALGKSELWELVNPGPPGPITDADVKRLNIVGGLSEDVTGARMMRTMPPSFKPLLM